jgi:hypothetical protein
VNPIRLCTATVALAVAALVACTAPSLAAAAGEPQITSAGIDETDRFVVTWTLAPGTTFDTIELSSSSIVDTLIPDTFADYDSASGFECAPPPEVCEASPTLTSYRESARVSRDRRYFVFVTAVRGDKRMRSATWVIDETKPLIPGKGKPSDTPTNTPVLGRPYVPPAPETVPAPGFSLLAPIPRTIGGFLRRGIRTRLTCPVFECYAFVALELSRKGPTIVDGTARPDGRRTFVLRPSKVLRARLRGHSRARLQLSVDISQPGGKQTEIARSISLRR